jgi:hypothetical protein
MFLTNQGRQIQGLRDKLKLSLQEGKKWDNFLEEMILQNLVPGSMVLMWDHLHLSKKSKIWFGLEVDYKLWSHPIQQHMLTVITLWLMVYLKDLGTSLIKYSQQLTLVILEVEVVFVSKFKIPYLHQLKIWVGDRGPWWITKEMLINQEDLNKIQDYMDMFVRTVGQRPRINWQT